MESLWNMHGICMEYVWNMYGTCNEYVWNMHGIGMEYVWNMHGTPGLPLGAKGAWRPHSREVCQEA